ncbi:hypothetical protein MAR_000787, partial [Mya arenaria]
MLCSDILHFCFEECMYCHMRAKLKDKGGVHTGYYEMRPTKEQDEVALHLHQLSSKTKGSIRLKLDRPSTFRIVMQNTSFTNKEMSD